VEARGAVSMEMLLHNLPPRHEPRVYTAERGLRTTSPAASRKKEAQKCRNERRLLKEEQAEKGEA